MAIDAALVARLFDLGEPRSEPVPLVGNGTAGAWRLDTGTGRWVVKAARAAEPWEFAAMRDSGDLERAALSAGVRVARPLEPRGESAGYWAAVPGGSEYVRVSEWTPGRQPCIPADKWLAEWLGESVAAMAAAVPPAAVDQGRGYSLRDLPEWRERLGRAAAVIGPVPAGRLLAAVEEGTAIVEAGLATAPGFVLCHRDISFRNILLTGRGPALIDFDLAGPEVPWWELVHFAFLLACTSLGDDEPEPALIEAAVSAYAERGGQVGTAEAVAFTGLLRGMLEWAAYNLALAGPPGRGDVVKPSVRAEAVARLAEAAKVLPVIVRSIDRWANLLESAST
ncbi:phosphotransferase family protein [Nonomuraea sp. NEAU-A123]|uniref:phosphotransferase family protein n=1 Tax=Nonomuraea sp. NEAU-A123 TaxID=2839649 RepID=UPI001BE3E033|nr:phosphotransferase [Nonomuraea sp. NEAU-A123]MBT2234558.1 phosphotransferase [Nonomuraea sp. NEAU-A123]